MPSVRRGIMPPCLCMPRRHLARFCFTYQLMYTCVLPLVQMLPENAATAQHIVSALHQSLGPLDAELARNGGRAFASGAAAAAARSKLAGAPLLDAQELVRRGTGGQQLSRQLNGFVATANRLWAAAHCAPQQPKRQQPAPPPPPPSHSSGWHAAASARPRLVLGAVGRAPPEQGVNRFNHLAGGGALNMDAQGTDADEHRPAERGEQQSAAGQEAEPAMAASPRFQVHTMAYYTLHAGTAHYQHEGPQAG